jgi:hypothetical protein
MKRVHKKFVIVMCGLCCWSREFRGWALRQELIPTGEVRKTNSDGGLSTAELV